MKNGDSKIIKKTFAFFSKPKKYLDFFPRNNDKAIGKFTDENPVTLKIGEFLTRKMKVKSLKNKIEGKVEQNKTG